MPSDVFFGDMRTKQELSMLDKVDRLFEQAGFAKLISPNELVAVKVHFGERGNTAYVRPQFARRVIDKISALGGNPFLTDANTLYVGSRANAVDHLKTAIENGFAYSVTGAPLIIADGLNGKDYVNVEINMKHFHSVKIASAAYHADAMLVITHFKGHEASGFGGAIKNVGMGLGSRSGKQQMHSNLRPKISREKCIGCGKCINWCPAGCIKVLKKKAQINEKKCIGCGECTVTCPERAIAINWVSDPDDFQEKIYVDVTDKFGGVHPMIDWSTQLRYAEEVGLGTRDYNLLKI